MDRDANDYSDARNMMVDGQVRPNKVYDSRILAAMRRIPRELFLPAHLAALAYADEDVMLANGRALIEPMLIARLLQLANVSEGEQALVVGAGSGYGAALLAACGARVMALEQDDALLAMARRVLPSVAPSVTIANGPLGEGWPAGAPYDVVLIEGAVEEIPQTIVAQLRPQGGRLVTVRLAQGRVGQAGIAEFTPATLKGGGPSFQPVFDCATPVLPAMCRTSGFVF
jgi:protein-L-isoaspartate(D-aspartate) O-methyltransferase